MTMKALEIVVACLIVWGLAWQALALTAMEYRMCGKKERRDAGPTDHRAA